MTDDQAKVFEKSDWVALAREVLDTEIAGIAEVRDRLNGGNQGGFSRALAMLGSCTGRVVVTGIGKSGLVGRKIAATFSSTGTPAFFLHPVEGAHGDLGMIRPEDVVLAISNSGETGELNAILPTLRSLGARIIALTGGSDSTLANMAEALIDVGVTREACPLDLAPTASTTAALAVGDALAVCLIRLKDFKEADFARFHPGGALGHRLKASVAELMHAAPPCVDESATLAQALAVLNAGGLGAVLVAADGASGGACAGRLVGIVTDGDVRRLLCAGDLDTGDAVCAAMVKNPKSVRPDQPAAQALDIMESKAITVLPVVDGQNVVVGIIHLHDLLGKGHLKFA